MEDYARRDKKKRNQIRYVKNASFESYIRKLLSIESRQQRFPEGDASISESALKIVDDMIKNLFEDLSSEAKQMMVASKKRTLDVWELQQAVAVILKGEAGKNAIEQALKAVRRYKDLAR